MDDTTADKEAYDRLNIELVQLTAELDVVHKFMITEVYKGQPLSVRQAIFDDRNNKCRRWEALYSKALDFEIKHGWARRA